MNIPNGSVPPVNENNSKDRLTNDSSAFGRGVNVRERKNSCNSGTTPQLSNKKITSREADTIPSAESYVSNKNTVVGADNSEEHIYDEVPDDSDDFYVSSVEDATSTPNSRDVSIYDDNTVVGEESIYESFSADGTPLADSTRPDLGPLPPTPSSQDSVATTEEDKNTLLQKVKDVASTVHKWIDNNRKLSLAIALGVVAAIGFATGGAGVAVGLVACICIISLSLVHALETPNAESPEPNPSPLPSPLPSPATNPRANPGANAATNAATNAETNAGTNAGTNARTADATHSISDSSNDFITELSKAVTSNPEYEAIISSVAPGVINGAHSFAGDNTSLNVNDLLRQTIKDCNFGIEEVNKMIDDIDSKNDSEALNGLVNRADLSRADVSNVEEIYINIRDVLVEYKQEKLSEYKELDISTYSQHQRMISAPYLAQMNALNIEFKGLLKHEIDDIRAVCNYNADNILQNNDGISAKKFKDLLLSKVKDDARRGNLNPAALDAVIKKFTENKFFK
jgi:hypothetical protein